MPVGSGLVFVTITVPIKHDVNDWDFGILDGFDYALCTVSSHSRDRVDQTYPPVVLLPSFSLYGKTGARNGSSPLKFE
jgi:hypothetical protein